MFSDAGRLRQCGVKAMQGLKKYNISAIQGLIRINSYPLFDIRIRFSPSPFSGNGKMKTGI